MPNNKLYKWSEFSFRRRLLVIMTFSGLIQLLILSAAGFIYLKDWQSQDSGNKALGVAKFLAATPMVNNALQQQNPQLIQNEIEVLRSSINAAFIVVGDINGIRYSHPIAERVGLKMQGGDNDNALIDGLSYVSYAKGSLGNSVRGKTPVYDPAGNIIGVVSVGYLVTTIDDKVYHFLFFLIAMALLVVLANALISNFTARRFQNAILGFEPEEFGRLYMELQVTLSTIKEGIISIDKNSYVTSINHSACQILNLKSEQVLHQSLKSVLPESDLTDILLTNNPENDIDIILNGQAIIANRQLIIVEGEVVGAVSSFRLKNEITELTKQLSQIREYADLLRSQTHEHRNKLNTISGLIQLGKKAEVLRLIGQETERYQYLIQFLREAILEPIIAGVLLGKSERARELGLVLDIDDGSRLLALSEHIRPEDLVTILGNFIDNAFEACLSALVLNKQDKKVSVSITDYGEEIIIEVEDNGCGLPQQFKQQRLIQKNVSSKPGKHRGVGLYLVDQIITQYKGQLIMEGKDSKGARVTAYIPKILQKVR
ncbi:MAG: two-component system CitB family sensor kinase [Psychromonas sp.]|jgi:two-component system CitB family sensor kinase|uniref:ATP-binding protein n=1 Tax=Psychromonas sp. TaxID=1884585 RepID=UPI0039E310E9